MTRTDGLNFAWPLTSFVPTHKAPHFCSRPQL